jgi:hypothetical protein
MITVCKIADILSLGSEYQIANGKPDLNSKDPLASIRKSFTVKDDGFVKSQFCSLSDHLGAFQTVLLNFKNSSQAPQTA